MPRILFLSNIPTPYQIDFFNTLSTLTSVKGVFLWEKQSNHDWAINHPHWLHILKYQDSSSAWSKLRSILDEFEPDTVIVGGYRLPLAHHLKWHAFQKRWKFYYWLEKPLPSSGIKSLLRYIMQCLTLPYSDGIFCIGSNAVHVYQAFSRNIFNLPYSIDLSRYPLRVQTPAVFPLRFLFVGQYIVRKGVPELLEAFSRIAPEKASLSLIGSGELEHNVVSYTRSHSHIKQLGYINPETLPEIFRNHDVFILPSRHDGWAVVVSEALACGLPVISTIHTTAFVDLVASNEYGIACDITADSIQNAVEHYLTHIDDVRSQGLKGREMLSQSIAVSQNAARALLQYIGTHA